MDDRLSAESMLVREVGLVGRFGRVDRFVGFDTAADTALSVPGAFDQSVKLPFGEMRAEDGFGFPFGDLLIHTWDLARAVGASDRLIPEACTIALAQLEPIDGLIRGPAVFGPRLEPAPGADIQDRLLAFVGRRV